MIAADSSTWVAFLQGDGGEDLQLLQKALQDRQVLMAPAVLTEVLSAPQLPSSVAATLSEIPLIEVTDGYWERAGMLEPRCWAGIARLVSETPSSPRLASIGEFRF